MATKVVIENAVLRGSPEDGYLQRVAHVYINGEELRVLAPPKGTGSALEWFEHWQVRETSKDDFLGGDVMVTDWRRGLAVEAVREELKKHELDADIWRNVNSQGRYCAAQICLRGHVYSIDGTGFKPDERCPKCGEICIDRCQNCKAPIRGAVVYSKDYTLAFYCYNCGRPYPWMEDRLQTARELLFHDDKLGIDDKEKLWGLLQYVMSDPKSDMAPAKKKLFDIGLGKALPATKQFFIEFGAKYLAELSKP
jgi:hypothetical protein